MKEWPAGKFAHFKDLEFSAIIPIINEDLNYQERREECWRQLQRFLKEEIHPTEKNVWETNAGILDYREDYSRMGRNEDEPEE
jgi:hypothetical protein